MGAFSNEGLYWIAPSGKLIPVNVPPYQMYSSHEEYANEKWKVSLEEALQKKYIRLQAITGKYLFIDHEQDRLKSSQIPTLEDFFYKNGSPISYQHIIVERIGSDMKEFTGNQLKSALAFAIDGSDVEEDEKSTGNTMSAQGMAAYGRQRDIEALHPYYQKKSSPLGDSVLDFKQWLKINN